MRSFTEIKDGRVVSIRDMVFGGIRSAEEEPASNVISNFNMESWMGLYRTEYIRAFMSKAAEIKKMQKWFYKSIILMKILETMTWKT